MLGRRARWKTGTPSNPFGLLGVDIQLGGGEWLLPQGIWWVAACLNGCCPGVAWQPVAVRVASAVCSGGRALGEGVDDAGDDAATVADHGRDDAPQIVVDVPSPGAKLRAAEVFTGGFFEAFV
jgi:hypothetical protein